MKSMFIRSLIHTVCILGCGWVCEGRLGILGMLRRLLILRRFRLVGILGMLGKLEMRRSHWNGEKARNGSNK